MSIKKAYYYLFYKLYKSYEAAPSRGWSDWKASFSIDVLIYFLLLALAGYYSIYTKEILFQGNPILLVVFIVLSVSFFNYYVFHRNDSWKEFVKEFDKLPKRKNLIGTVIVWSIIVFVFINLIFMFYLLSQIDWKEYR